MVDKSAAALDRVFHALASAPRREILRRTARRRYTVTELAEHFDMSLAAVSKHVVVLDQADLLVQTRQGRRLWRRLNPAALAPALDTIEALRRFWSRALDGLERYLLAEQAAAGQAAAATKRGAAAAKRRRPAPAKPRRR